MSPPEGGYYWRPEFNKYRPINNGLELHKLSFEQLIALIIGLTKVILRPGGLGASYFQDHRLLCSWCAQIILHRDTVFFDRKESQLHILLGTCARSFLAGSVRYEEKLLSHNDEDFLNNSGLILSLIAFPMLEGVLKVLCNEYITMDGVVLSKFDIVSKNKKIRTYNPKSRCSSLRDLLFLMHENIADAGLKASLDEFKANILVLDNSEDDAFDVLYNWRNESLHGVVSFPTVGGTILNLVFLIIIHQISNRYDSLRDNAVRYCEWEARSGTRFRESFYPPE